MRRDAAAPSASTTNRRFAADNSTARAVSSIDTYIDNQPPQTPLPLGWDNNIRSNNEIYISISLLPRPLEAPPVVQQVKAEILAVCKGLWEAERDRIKADLSTATSKSTRDPWRYLKDLYTHLLDMYDVHPERLALPSRMWIRAILPFLKLFQRRLPASTDDMPSFIERAHSMVTRCEVAPESKNSWIEVLQGYQTAIQARGRETPLLISGRFRQPGVCLHRKGDFTAACLHRRDDKAKAAFCLHQDHTAQSLMSRFTTEARELLELDLGGPPFEEPVSRSHFEKLQLESAQVTMEALRCEARTYYVTIDMVESECIEARMAARIPGAQVDWCRIIELHILLLNEHFDFWHASEKAKRIFGERAYESEDKVLENLSSVCIRPFLQLVKDKDCSEWEEHVLTFIHYAHWLVNLYHTAPGFNERSWICIRGEIEKVWSAIG